MMQVQIDHGLMIKEIICESTLGVYVSDLQLGFVKFHFITTICGYCAFSFDP